MKTVSGAVVSSKPVSLSKAAKILSKFALADNGASPAYVAYLMRASDSFDELVQFHKELRGSGSEQKSKKHRSGNHIVEKPVDSITNHSEDQDSIGGRKKDSKEKKAGDAEKKDEAGLVNGHDSKKQKKMKEIEGKLDSENVDDSWESRKIRKELKKELKKIKKDGAIEEGRSNGIVEAQGNGGEMKVADGNGGKRSKKRKSEAMADEEAFGSAEKQVHKKKNKKKGRNESDA